MEKTVYDKRSWRSLPREFCTVEALLGEAAGPCGGLIHLHHTDPSDPSSRAVPVCATHHPKIHAALRTLTGATERPVRAWKRCTHHHPYPGGKEACEARLNA